MRVFIPIFLVVFHFVTFCHGLTLQQKQEIFAYNTAKLIIHIFESGYKCTLGEAFRTQEQAMIYAKEGLGIAHSKHCERLALDLNLFDSNGNFIHDDDMYKQFGTYWQNLNISNRAGCFWIHRPDADHFEMD